MKLVVRKLYINFEKEEKWLNEMAAKGLNLVDYSFSRYLFEEGKPSEYIYRIELLEHLPSHPESKAYINFMEDMGVECVAIYFRWIFFRKKAVEGVFDLYSDNDSRIKHYKRLCSLYGIVGSMNLIPALSNINIYIFENSKEWFSFNIIGFLNLLLASLCIWMCISYIKKIKKIKKEKDIYE